ncbi:MAG: hypothetical protein AABZ11_10745 [Nitrospinota bacterium]
MKRENQLIISLKDLYISSYLKALSFPLHDATLDTHGRTLFHFIETPDLKKALMRFYDGTAIVSPSAFIESFKSLRSLAYSLSDKKNMEVKKYGNSNQIYQA